MGNIVNRIKEVLSLKQNDEYYINLDKVIMEQKAEGVTKDDLDVLFTFMNKFVMQRPTSHTLLLVNRVICEMSGENRERFMEIYSIFLSNCEDEKLRNEVKWFMDYQGDRLRNN